MVWNPIWPNGAVSVKANTSTGQANTTYIETTLNKDHYYGNNNDTDGRHKYVTLPVQGSNPSISAGFDGIIFLKTIAGGRHQGFYSNSQSTYQFIPGFLQGSFTLTSSTSTYIDIVAVPDGTYGHIYTFKDNPTNGNNMTFGFFKAEGGVVQAYSCLSEYGLPGSAGDVPSFNIKLGNEDQAIGLNIRGRNDKGASGAGDYRYRVVYWGL